MNKLLSSATSTAALLLAARCALYSDVSVSPMHLKPGDIMVRSGGVTALVEQRDFGAAVLHKQAIEQKANATFREFAALGRAELAAGRLDDARRHLRRAYSMEPFYTDAGNIAWDLSQTEYLSNQYAAALEWAHNAQQNGISIRKWHLDYLEALSGQQIYTFNATKSARIALTSKEPNVPRVQVDVNDRQDITAVIDSGAAISIVSASFAERVSVQSLGDFTGTFYGLLGEPISVRFGLLSLVRIGKMEIRNVPVAIMGDDQLRFLVSNRKPFKMDFLLGANLLKEFRLQLDYSGRRATFTRLDARDRVVSNKQNLFWVGFRPFVTGTVNGKGWYLFALDTGSEVTFLNEKELANTPLRNYQTYHTALLQGLGGATKRGAKLEDIKIGVDRWNGDFRTIPLYGTERSQALGILGENFLQHFTVTIDFGAMTLTLDKDQSSTTFSTPEPVGSVAQNE